VRPATGLVAVTAAVLLAGSVPAARVRQAADVVEPHSGVRFPVSLVPPGGSTPHALAGTGIRVRTIFRVKVYAIGLYVDPAPARTALARFAGRPAADLARDQGLSDALLAMTFDMTLRLVMTRDVGGRDVARSFDDALRPRVRLAAADRAMPGGEAALAQFRGYFNLDEVAKGTEIVFSCSQGRRLETAVDRARRPAIDSPALCWALFDVYLGRRPIADDAKRSLVAGLADLLAARRPAQRPST
jgi:hypothetical protein